MDEKFWTMSKDELISEIVACDELGERGCGVLTRAALAGYDVEDEKISRLIDLLTELALTTCEMKFVLEEKYGTFVMS